MEWAICDSSLSVFSKTTNFVCPLYVGMEMLNIWNKSKYQFQKIGFVAFALWKSWMQLFWCNPFCWLLFENISILTKMRNFLKTCCYVHNYVMWYRQGCLGRLGWINYSMLVELVLTLSYVKMLSVVILCYHKSYSVVII